MFALCLPGAILTTFVTPSASASGIPGIIGFVNGVNNNELVSFPTAVVTFFGVIGSVASGLACGPEGPVIHLGACVGHVIGNSFPGIGTDGLSKRNLVMLGAGAGVAAAFMAPTAGVMLVVEELAFFSIEEMQKTFMACMLAWMTSYSLRGWFTVDHNFLELEWNVGVTMGNG